MVGSNRVIEMGGKRLRGRQYPWGIVEGGSLSFLCVLYPCDRCSIGLMQKTSKKDPLCPDSGDIHGFLFEAGSRSECSLVCALLAAMTLAISVLLSRFI